MTEKDLDIAIEKCERIMEFDTRTLKNPESENGYIFEKVYDLLQFLRQFQFSTGAKVDSVISRQEIINAQSDIPDINVIIDTIKNAINASTGNNAYMVGLRNGMRWCWSALTDKEPEYEDIPLAESKWIPCSEPPTENNSYFVWMPFAPKGHHITVAEWCGSYWNIKTPITAWMPIPESWKKYEEK